MADHRGWGRPALAIVGAVTAARVLGLALNRTDLFVDEAQYWLWGQELAFGYYSKPPLIGWVIRAMTDLAGSDAAFWVRLPGALCNAATALILGRIAAGLWGARAGVLAAALFVTLPMVAVGSLLISTDTVMFPGLAAALGLWLHLVSGRARRPLAVAAAAGVALGVAFMAKYAAIYLLVLAALAGLALPRYRPRPLDAAVLLAAFAVVIAPNVVWNLSHGLSTVEHTMDNAGWIRGGPAALHPDKMAEFLLAQFAVFGPVPFAVLLGLGLRRLAGPVAGVPGGLLWLSLPIVALVSMQGLLERAYANWAASAYLAGTLAVVPWLLARPVWLRLTFAINGAICLALPLVTILPDALTWRGQPLAARYLGRAALGEQILTAARQAGATAIVAEDRDVLADLFHTGRDAGLPIYAVPVDGPAPNHYALTHPYRGEATGPVLAVLGHPRRLPCAGTALPASPIAPTTGAYAGKRFFLFTVPADCWSQPAR